MSEWIDGDYPTDAALARIEAWPFEDVAGCFAFVREIWHWPHMARLMITDSEQQLVEPRDDEYVIRLATGGWSGNEAIVGALKANYLIDFVSWRLSTRGGLHIYTYRK